MVNTYSVIMSQLQATFEELEQYKVNNKRLQVEVKTNDFCAERHSTTQYEGDLEIFIDIIL